MAVLGSQIRLYGNPHSQGSATKSQVFRDLCDCCQFEPPLQFLLCDDPEVTKAMHVPSSLHPSIIPVKLGTRSSVGIIPKLNKWEWELAELQDSSPFGP